MMTFHKNTIHFQQEDSLSFTSFEEVSCHECELPVKKVMWQTNEGGLQSTNSKNLMACKELTSVNNHMSWKTDSSLNDLQMRPKA